MPFFDKVKKICSDEGTQFFIGENCVVLDVYNKNSYVLLPGFCDVLTKKLSTAEALLPPEADIRLSVRCRT